MKWKDQKASKAVKHSLIGGVSKSDAKRTNPRLKLAAKYRVILAIVSIAKDGSTFFTLSGKL